MISFCITCKNRSKVKVDNITLDLFPKCLDSIIEHCNEIEEGVEVVISDWNSTDLPLEGWVFDKFKDSNISVKIVQITDMDKFNLSHGRNVAYSASKGDKLFFIDADMLVCPEVILDGIIGINDGCVVFPICYFERGSLSKKERFGLGKKAQGNMFISRNNFELVGLWSSSFFYGGEDDSYASACFKNGIRSIREPYVNFIHQWHPRYLGWTYGGKRSKKFRQKIRQNKRKRKT